MIPLGNVSQNLPRSAFAITLLIAAKALHFMPERHYGFLSATLTAKFLESHRCRWQQSLKQAL
jgi:hypothetical protein